MVKFLESLFNAIRERVRNPVVPAFVISWCVLNFERLFVLLASTKPAEERVADFDLVWWVELLLTGASLAIAAAYVEFMPKLVLFIQRRQIEPQKTARIEKTKAEREIAIEERLTEEEKLKVHNLRDDLNVAERMSEFEQRLVKIEDSNENSTEAESQSTLPFVIRDVLTSGNWQQVMVENTSPESLTINVRLFKSEPAIDNVLGEFSWVGTSGIYTLPPYGDGLVNLVWTGQAAGKLKGTEISRLGVGPPGYTPDDEHTMPALTRGDYSIVVRFQAENRRPLDYEFKFLSGKLSIGPQKSD